MEPIPEILGDGLSGIRVYIPDATYGIDDAKDWLQRSADFKKRPWPTDPRCAWGVGGIRAVNDFGSDRGRPKASASKGRKVRQEAEALSVSNPRSSSEKGSWRRVSRNSTQL